MGKRKIRSWGHRIGRRDLIALVGAAALASPQIANGQATEKLKLLVALAPIPVDDPFYRRNLGAMRNGLKKRGWIEGTNLKIEPRSTMGGDMTHMRAVAREILQMSPDVIVAVTAPIAAALKQETATVPVVFIVVDDPVGLGFVASLAKPGGNITGFAQFEPSIGGKWLGLLKEIAPTFTSAGILFNPRTASEPALYHRSIGEGARSFGVTVTPLPITDEAGIRNEIAGFARARGGGLIVPPDAFTVGHRAPIIAAAAEFRLPAVYAYDILAKDSGLMSYSVDQLYQIGECASYVDRILHGAKPADLPAQTPKKYQLTINLKTAKALGLAVPPTLLAQADEVIE